MEYARGESVLLILHDNLYYLSYVHACSFLQHEPVSQRNTSQSQVRRKCPLGSPTMVADQMRYRAAERMKDLPRSYELLLIEDFATTLTLTLQKTRTTFLDLAT
jgi:hypothetical protein